MNDRWQDRLVQMERWYTELLSQGIDDAERQLMWDYRPYAERLSLFRGRVIDVGGGAGLARHFLHSDVDYWVVDPSDSWQKAEWQKFGRRFHEGPVHFVPGVGEDLPFGDAEFDGALALWSFNHARDPSKCLCEMRRVLKPGGRALVILEDMEPTLWDTFRLWLQELRTRRGRRPDFPIGWHQEKIQTARQTLLHRLARRPWPLQPDHVRIQETRLKEVMRGRFQLLDRNWAGGFLAYEMTALGGTRTST